MEQLTPWQQRAVVAAIVIVAFAAGVVIWHLLGLAGW